MSDVFFNNVVKIAVDGVDTKKEKLNLKLEHDIESSFISLNYNKSGKNFHIILSLVDNIDSVYFNFIISMIESTSEGNIDELHELIKDWFEVEAIKTLKNIKEYEGEQKKLF